MQSDHSRQFTARLAELTAVGVFIEEYCLLRALPREVALRLTFVVEELFTNSVLHGYGGERDAPIWVGLSGAGGMVELCYEDAAPPYDPLLRLQEGHAAPVASTVSGRPIGGLGVFLVAQLAQTARYAHIDGRNRLTVALAAEP
jgi:anti-sigma regulatory factor (Ser/Thr protein kinase)